MNRREVLVGAAAVAMPSPVLAASAVPEKTIVLTMDDAVKSHRTFAAPLLKELGFRATFFVTQRWMDAPEHFMSWKDIGELHRMGFEIGNHSWTHAGFGSPQAAATLADELSRVEAELAKVDVPRPRSFGWCGNAFGPEAVAVLRERGYCFARRGMQPEIEYGKIAVGPAYDPTRHHPLLIPTTGDAYPDWTFDHFKKVLAEARRGRIVVLQFHGVPDVAHPWVNTPPERFREYMTHLKDGRYRVRALKDVAKYVDADHLPDDPLLQTRYPLAK
jgi:peptidoglycan/xylan/chitin deacetylase (PgdA/CDA1 family)